MNTLNSLVCAVLICATPWAAAQPLDLGGFKVAQTVRIEPVDTALTLQGG